MVIFKSMTLSPVEIAAYISASVLAASKLFSAIQPLWNKLPRPLSVAMPVLVLMLPQVAHMAGLVQTGSDLVMLAVSSVALLLPGIAEAELPKAPPSA